LLYGFGVRFLILGEFISMMRLRFTYSEEFMEIPLVCRIVNVNVASLVLTSLVSSSLVSSPSLIFGKLISMMRLRFTYSKEFM
jgi:hypothetical protein